MMTHTVISSWLSCDVLTQDKATGQERIWFKFQKAKYVYDAEEKKTFCPIIFPINEPIDHYVNWKGYQDDESVKNAVDKYGNNE